MNMEVVNALCAVGAFKVISGYALVKIEKKCEEKYMKSLFTKDGYEINRKKFKPVLKKYRDKGADELYFWVLIPFPFDFVANLDKEYYDGIEFHKDYCDNIEKKVELEMDGVLKRKEEMIDKRINNIIFSKDEVKDSEIEMLKYDDDLLYNLYTKRMELKADLMEIEEFINSKEKQCKIEKSKYKMNKDLTEEYKSVLLGKYYEAKRNILLLLEKIEAAILSVDKLSIGKKYDKKERNEAIKEQFNEQEIDYLNIYASSKDTDNQKSNKKTLKLM